MKGYWYLKEPKEDILELRRWNHLLYHLFSKYLLSIYCDPDMVLFTRDRAVNKTSMIPALAGLQHSGGYRGGKKRKERKIK